MRKHEYRKKRYYSSRSAEYHCRACDFYGTPVTREEKQKKKEELAEKLLCERVPRCGIARAVRVRRNRVIFHIEKKKSDLPDRQLRGRRNVRLPEGMRYGLLSDRNNSEYGFGQQLIAIRGRQSAQLPEIGEMKRVGIYGSLFLPIIGNALLFIRIIGKAIRIFCLRSVIGQSEKKAVRQRILSVLTILYVRCVLLRYGKRFLSVKMRRCMKSA